MIGAYSGTENSYDNGPAWVSSWGVSGAPFTSADQHAATAAVTDAPAAGQKLCIDDLLVSVDTTMWVKFQEQTSGVVLLGPLYLSANLPYQFTFRSKLRVPTKDRLLMVQTSVPGNITVSAGYHSES